jgi:hypothetical protein
VSIAAYMAELADPATNVSSTGLMSLSGIYGEEVEELCRAWSGLPLERRRELVTKLVELAEENVEMDFYEVLCHAMLDEDAAVRERAISGLWENDDRRTIPKLVERLRKDVDASVRAASATVLGHFAQLAEAGKLIERDRDRVYGALMDTLGDECEPLEVRRRALESIGAFQVPEVRDWVRWGYHSDDPLLRQSAVFAMGRSSDSVWLDIVCDELSSDDPAMRFEAANAARELAGEEAVPKLADLVQDDDRQVAMAALQALGGIGGARAKKLLRGYAAMAEDEAVREAAEVSLRLIQTEEADVFSLEPERLDGES